MAISEQQLAGILGNAKKLCNPQADRAMDNYIRENHNGGSTSNDSDYRSWNDNGFGDELTAQKEIVENVQTQKQPQAFQQNINKSRLPEAIKKSMMEHQYQFHDMTEEGKLNAAVQGLTQQKQQVTETYTPVQQQPQAFGSGVDSNFIKFLIKESLKEYFAERESLNEGTTLKQIGLSEGKIRLVDNKGNIFSAQLQLTGNIKDRKKS